MTRVARSLALILVMGDQMRARGGSVVREVGNALKRPESSSREIEGEEEESVCVRAWVGFGLCEHGQRGRGQDDAELLTVGP